MKFIDDKSKNLHWYNRNYFYAGTILFIVLCIALDAGLGFGWSLKLFDNTANYNNFKIINFLNGLFGSMDHSGEWQHILLNMLCYAIVSFYLERKYGSINYFSLTIFICFFSRMANMLILQSFTAKWGHSFLYGFSSANYALYAIFLIDYIFSFRKSKRNKTNIILGAVLIPIIYLFMCFNGGTESFGFDWWPSDFITNSWHWAGFGTGILTGLLIQITLLNAEHAYKNKENQSNKKELSTKVCDAQVVQKELLTEEAFLSNCVILARQFNTNKQDFTLFELVNKIVQNENETKNYVNNYGNKIYKTLKQDILNKNLDAKIILVKRGEEIIYEKIKFIKTNKN